MPDAGERDQPRTIDRPRGRPRCAHPQDGVLLAVEHQCGRAQVAQSRAVPLGADLAALRLGVPRPAVDLPLDPLPRGVLVERVCGRRHPPRDGEARLEVTVAPLGKRGPRELRQQTDAQVAHDTETGHVARQRGGGDDGPDAVGMAQGDALRDRATQGVAEDVRRRAAQLVEHRDSVVDHVLRRVRIALLAEERREGVRAGDVGHPGRLARVALVIAGDREALRGERLAQARRPPEPRRAQTHDQQQGHPLRTGEAVEGDVDRAVPGVLRGRPGALAGAGQVGHRDTPGVIAISVRYSSPRMCWWP